MARAGIRPRRLFTFMWVPSVTVLAAALVDIAWTAGTIFASGFAVVAIVLGVLVGAGLLLFSILPRIPLGRELR